MDETRALQLLEAEFRVILHDRIEQAIQQGQNVEALLRREMSATALPRGALTAAARTANEDVISLQEMLRRYKARTGNPPRSLWNNYVANNLDSMIEAFTDNQQVPL